MRLHRAYMLIALAGLGIGGSGFGESIMDVEDHRPSRAPRRIQPPTIYIHTPKPLTKRAKRRAKGKRA